MEEGSAFRKRKIREERTPACNACRKRKLKCDAHRDFSRPCSRCERDQVECIVPNERRMKGQLSSTSAQAPTQNQQDMGESIPVRTLGPDPAGIGHDSNPTLHSGPSSRAWSTPSQHTGLQHVPILEPGTFSQPSVTEARTISNITVEGSTIDELFNRFNTQYAPLISILPPQPNPNAVYNELPLKFWVILTIGSRKYDKEPALLAALAPHVETLAMTSLSPIDMDPYPVFEALLLMSTWNLTFDRPFYASFYIAISNALIAMTVQAGLHRCLSIQAVFPDRQVPRQDIIRGSKLWVHAITTNHSAMAISGLPANDLVGTSHIAKSQECCHSVPDSVILRARLMIIVTKANRVLSDLGLETAQSNHDLTIKNIVAAADAEILNLQNDTSLLAPLDQLNIMISRLQIRSISLLVLDMGTSIIELSQAFEAALETMNMVDKLQDTIQLANHCPEYIFQGVVLASSIILKLLKSFPSGTFNSREGTKALFSAITICSAEISHHVEDTASRVAQILSGLWSHDHAFQDVNGAFIQPLAFRNRLGASVVFECFARWRMLYRNVAGRIQAQNSSELAASSVAPLVESNLDTDIPLFTNDTTWDFDWGFLGPWNAPP